MPQKMNYPGFLIHHRQYFWQGLFDQVNLVFRLMPLIPRISLPLNRPGSTFQKALLLADPNS
jgi:hypothetical protein